MSAAQLFMQLLDTLFSPFIDEELSLRIKKNIYILRISNKVLFMYLILLHDPDHAVVHVNDLVLHSRAPFLHRLSHNLKK